MKVLMLNGSPKENGSTRTALNEVAKVLESYSIQTEIVHVGSAPVQDCTGCMACRKTSRCKFDTDHVNATADLLRVADGFIVGSPVHYAGPTGAVGSFLSRMFYSASASFAHKPAAAIVCCRRSGATAALDRLQKYFSISQMPVVSSQYWNVVHGHDPEDLRHDPEGMQTMRTLAHNMAWTLQNLKGAPNPDTEPRQRTNFVRK